MFQKIIFFSSVIILGGCAESFVMFSDKPLPPSERVSSLKGYSSHEIVQLLGEPLLRRQEGDHELWCYREGMCSTFVFFNAEKYSVYAENRGECTSVSATR